MTEKEKAKAYDEAIERAKKLYGNGIIEEIFPELKESKDKKIREAILNGLIDCRDAPDLGWSNFGGIHINDCIDWLEKQGEQKPQGKSALEAIKEENVDNANKVEPKFKVGDWITSNLSNSSNLLRIIGIDETNYEVVTPQGSTGVPSIRYIDKHFHLWTIEDAEDGDVLVHNSFMFDDFIFIYNNTSALQAYCYYSSERNRFIIEDRGHSYPWNMQEVTPATKEQRDTLMKAIKDAGYEWDADKKELKKEKVE